MKDWRDLAECYGMPLELFFGGSGKTDPTAVAACAGCPVRTECLNDELDIMRRLIPAGSSHGYRGGTTARRRARILAEERAEIARAKLLRDAITLIYGAAMEADRDSRDAQSQLMRGRRVNPPSGPRPKAAKLAS